jgi:hypothetical protein
MKTTVEIPDAILEAAKRQAAERGITLRSLIETGLRTVLASERAPAFELRDASVDGNGVQDDVAEGGWAAIMERSYEGRGGA